MQQVWKLIESGRLPEAETSCTNLLIQTPDLLEARFALAVIDYKRGETRAALDRIEQVLAVQPGAFSALTLGARIFFESEDYARALEFARKAFELKPNDIATLSMIARCLRAERNYFEALQAYDAMSQIEPRESRGYFGLAEVFAEMGSSFDAAEALRRGIELAPSRERLLTLAETELSLGRRTQALTAARKILLENSADLSANLIAARCLTELGRFEAAEPYWRSAGEDPDTAWRSLRQKAYALSIAGQFSESEICLLESLRLNSAQGASYQLMFAGRKASEQDRNLIDRMEALSSSSDLAEDELAPIHFALGKAWDDLNDPARAMAHYDKANTIRLAERNAKTPFRPSSWAAQFELHRRLYSSPFSTVDGPAASQPIFIVGMMRSGTTLLEQILSAHSEVVGAGELDFWPGSEVLMIDTTHKRLRPEAVAERRSAYSRLLTSIGGDSSRVVDKNPANLMAAGLIHQVFPHSPIINLRRNPLDTAVSIWMTDASAPFMADRSNIVFAIQQAFRQADFWGEIIPRNRFLDLRYEDLVQDPERWTRVVLDFCALTWSADCLAPNKKSNNVRTPSLWQVRQPIYRSSVSRWKRYEPWLGEFRQLLDQA